MQDSSHGGHIVNDEMEKLDESDKKQLLHEVAFLGATSDKRGRLMKSLPHLLRRN